MSSEAKPANDFTFHYVTAPEVIAMGSVLPALGIIFVIMRFMNRLSQGGTAKVGVDDWLIIGGLSTFERRQHLTEKC